jgi:hypothetical protein
MVAAFGELYQGLAAVAPLPAVVIGLLQNFPRRLVLRTVPRLMPLPVTNTAYFRFAVAALGVLAAILELLDPVRLDPLSTSSSRAVDPVAGRELGKLVIPCLLERDIEQPIHVLDRDGILAALGRHVLRVFDGNLEETLHTGMTHSMATLEPRRLGGR